MKSKKQYYLLVPVTVLILLGGLWFYNNSKVFQLEAEQTIKQQTVENANTSGANNQPSLLLAPQKTVTTGVKPDLTYLSPAELHLLEQWEESQGLSKELRDIYESYDYNTLVALAKDGDIYAMQAGVNTAEFLLVNAKNYDRRKVEVLLDAAAKDSTGALFSLGRAASADLESLQDGKLSEEEVRRRYGLVDLPMPIEQAMETLAVTHYVVAAMRGQVSSARISIKYFQQEVIKREFTKKEWRTIAFNAEQRYGEIQDRRNVLGLGAFDNSYPEAYARHHGYSENNNTLEGLKAYANEEG